MEPLWHPAYWRPAIGRLAVIGMRGGQRNVRRGVV
jgi:hypothetical protein